MKVAIIGAGTSGLACAIELEKHGIHPVIFERNDFIGEYHSHVSALLGLITRPITDPIAYLDRQLGIKLTPLNQLKKVTHHSPNNQFTVTGSLGYLLLRGKEENSVKNQLHSQIKSKVRFNSYVQPEELEKEFDFVVVADGHWSIPMRYGIWQEIMRTWLMGGIFEGDFEDDTLLMWLDKELTNGIYVYAAPFSKNKAVIAQVVQNINQEDLNNYWQRFLQKYDILKKYTLIDTWQLPHHAGFVTTNRVGKIYFTGTAGGGVEPFLGFGQFNAIVSGVLAAKSIAKGDTMNELIQGCRKKSLELYTLRSALNNMTNQDLDRLLSVMKIPGLGGLIYKTDLDVVKLVSAGLKIVSSNHNQLQLPKGWI